MEEPLKQYYDLKNPGSFGGVDRLYKQLKIHGYSKDEVKDFLSSQNAYTLHKDRRRKFPRNRVLAYSKDYEWMADLADLQQYSSENDGYKYILVIIDVFTKFVWARAMKTKQPGDVKRAFENVFEDGRKPIRLQTDKGGEFCNSMMRPFFENHDILHFTSTNTTFKCSIVERVNRTIKSRMFRYFTAKNSKRYVDILQDLIQGYNDSYHRSIKMTPNEALETDPKIIFKNLYGDLPFVTPKLKPGDHVRIANDKTAFEKTYLGTFKAQSTVKDVLRRNIPQYQLNAKTRILYPQEVQKIKKPVIENVISTRRRQGKTQHLVSYVGQPTQEWIEDGDLSHGLEQQ